MTEEILRGFPKTLQTALRDGKWDYATRLFNDEKYAEDVKNNSWDLIPVITEHLTEENRYENTELFKCCIKLLHIISETSNSEEALLQFVSEVEEAKQESKFVCLLEPLAKVIARVPTKKVNSIAWSFNAIHTYLGRLTLPDYESFEGKERLLVDNNDANIKIIRLYTDVLVFYDSFMKNINKSTDKETKCVLCKFLVQLLGIPLCYLSMECFGFIKTEGRCIAEDVVVKVFKTLSDPLTLAEMLHEKQSDELIKPDALSIANFFYLVYYEGICFEIVPKIYSSRYMFENTLPLICVLLDQNNVILTEKAFKLALSVFNLIRLHSLSYLLLDYEDNSKFCKDLTQVIVYHDSETLRKTGLEVFTKYLNCYEIRGIYLVVSNMMNIVTHSGLIGYMITFYKNLLSHEFDDNEENLSEYFKGPKLFSILRKFCCLHEKEATNIGENSDQIVSCLNLLRYLALRDKKNITKIWDFFPTLEDIYFEVLRKALELSRAHYELEIKNLKKESSFKPNTKIDATVTVKGNELSKMSSDEKVQVLSATLTVFDVIDSLLSRVIELFDHKSM